MSEKPFLISLFLVISGAAFSLFVIAGAATGWVIADGSVVYDLGLLPKRFIAAQFLFGQLHSLIITIPLGLLAVLDFNILGRSRIKRRFAGLSLPLAILSVGYWWYRGDYSVMVALLFAAILLWLLFRVVLLISPRVAT